MPADLPATRDFASFFRLLLQCGARGSDGARVGSEGEALNARQGNGRSTLGNPLCHGIHEGCASATLTAIWARHVPVSYPAADPLLRVLRSRPRLRGAAPPGTEDQSAGSAFS